jgi:hypothetical protein
MPQTVLVAVQQVVQEVLVLFKLVVLVRQVKVMQEVMLWGPLMAIPLEVVEVLVLLAATQQLTEAVLVGRDLHLLSLAHNCFMPLVAVVVFVQALVD